MRALRRIVVGFFALLGLVVFVIVGGGVALWLWTRPPAPEIAEGTILTLDLTKAPPDEPATSGFARLLTAERLPLRDVLDGLERAAADPRVKGLIARISEADFGIAEIQELRTAIVALRAAGKHAVAYADSYGEFAGGTRSYYLATAFDEIWVQPLSSVGLIGLRAEVPFLKGTLDLLGLEPRLDHREEYKTAMNSLTETKMTAAHREETQALLDSLFGQIQRGIADRRKMEPTQVRALVDRGPFLAKDAQEAHLVDHVGYRDEALAALKSATGNTKGVLSLNRYLDRVGRPHRMGPVIALVYARGLIVSGDDTNDSPFGNSIVGADTVIRGLRRAEEDGAVRAILFRIDSPGGSAVASESIWRAVMHARERGKPVIASMGNVAGSGGYYIAAGADKIVAEPGTLTGSIGVFAGKILVNGLMSKLGVSWDAAQVGDDAAMFSLFQDYSTQTHDRFEGFLDDVYSGFKARVAQGRKLTADDVEKVAKGRVWTGEDAKKNKLVDELGGYATALRLAKQAGGIGADEEVTIRIYPPPRNPLGAFFARLTGADRDDEEGVAALPRASLAHEVGALAPALRQLERLVSPPGVLTMPPIEVR